MERAVTKHNRAILQAIKTRNSNFFFFVTRNFMFERVTKRSRFFFFLCFLIRARRIKVVPDARENHGNVGALTLEPLACSRVDVI